MAKNSQIVKLEDSLDAGLKDLKAVTSQQNQKIAKIMQLSD